jgi:hypothetical protein
MAHLSGYHILIIDFPGACNLREKLVRAGACVHVATERGAMILARTKLIDAAFIAFDPAITPVGLGERLIQLGVRQIISTAPEPVSGTRRQAAASASWRSLLGSSQARAWSLSAATYTECRGERRCLPA